MKIAIIGSRGYPYVYSGYETFVKEISERLVKKKIEITVYCHRGLFNAKPKKINGINLVYVPSIETKFFSQIVHSFLSFVHCGFKKPDLIPQPKPFFADPKLVTIEENNIFDFKNIK